MYRRGVVGEEIERVSIKFIEGQELNCVSSEIYLGTLLTPKMKASREIPADRKSDERFQ